MALLFRCKNFLATTAIFIFANTCFAEIAPYEKARPQFAKKEIILGGKRINVEVADSDEKRAFGLMFKKALLPNEGMLFIFDEVKPLSFWMKNTFIDLDIGYFNEKKILTEIYEMKATTIMQEQFPSYPSKKPAQYALELNAGWFKKNKIKVGEKLNGSF